MGIEAALSIHVLTFFWELEQADVLLLAPTYVLGAVGGVALAPVLVRWITRKRMLQIGILAWAVFQGIPVVLRLAGWFPENGDPLLLPGLMAFRLLQGIAAIQCDVAFGAMMADSVDEHELATGNRQEGMFFAASSIAVKAPFGIGSFVGGLALNLIDWPTGSDIRTAGDIDPNTIVQLGVLVGPRHFPGSAHRPVVLCLVSADPGKSRRNSQATVPATAAPAAAAATGRGAQRMNRENA